MRLIDVRAGEVLFLLDRIVLLDSQFATLFNLWCLCGSNLRLLLTQTARRGNFFREHQPRIALIR